MEIETAVLEIFKLVSSAIGSRQRKREIKFSNVIEPIFNKAETLYSELISILEETSERLKDTSPIEPIDSITTWFLSKRRNNIAQRASLRAIGRTTFMSSLQNKANSTRYKYSNTKKTLYRSIHAVLCGGLSITELGRLETPDQTGIDTRGHTLLDVINRAEKPGTYQDRIRLIEKTELQISNTTKAWTSATIAFNELREIVYHAD